MASRRQKRLDRLRKKLKEKATSLAEEFEYKLFILVVYNDPRKDPLVYEAEKVALWMTNNAMQDGDSKEVQELAMADTVQVHAMQWFALNSRKMDTVEKMDLRVWPKCSDDGSGGDSKNNIRAIEAMLFSRWKTGSKKSSSPYKLLSQRFVVRYFEIERHIRRFLETEKKRSMDPKGDILFNGPLNFAIWLTKKRTEKNTIGFNLRSVMVCVPQAELTRWIAAATFDTFLPFEKVVEYQMALWKDLAAMDHAKNGATDAKWPPEVKIGELLPFNIEDLPSDEIVKRAALVTIANVHTENESNGKTRKSQREAEAAGTLDALRFLNYAIKNRDLTSSSTSTT
eukprot:CAMPEP_0184499528 /NCGR_PEP_ID=MMETSP0113_2-20130426/41717_1 /TAXON_ID=91329 /ORGANISM="Norrisiella sphaerica, Strain BC52" /LENGTH=340 /DNA_ID=CAMNT_0026887457 /DNA_START=195 /DNA_END=1217 /DNA_ORIENTATION=+